jgi:hypothetical protein
LEWKKIDRVVFLPVPVRQKSVEETAREKLVFSAISIIPHHPPVAKSKSQQINHFFCKNCCQGKKNLLKMHSTVFKISRRSLNLQKCNV